MNTNLIEYYGKLLEMQKLSREALALHTHLQIKDATLASAIQKVDNAIQWHLSDFEINLSKKEVKNER